MDDGQVNRSINKYVKRGIGRAVRGAKKKVSHKMRSIVSEEELLIFGLTEAEAKIIIALLELGPTGVSKLSRETELSHTTVHSAIRRIRDQGLVRRVSRGYASVWKVISVQRLQKKLRKTLHSIDQGALYGYSEEELGINSQENKEFAIFLGEKEILKVLQWFLLNNRQKQVYIMQSYNSCKSFYQDLEPDLMAQIKGLFIQNHVSVDMIVSRETTGLYDRFLPQNESLIDILEKQKGAIHLVPNHLLTAGTETIVADTLAIVIDWGKLTLTLIKEENMLITLQNLFFLLRSQGEPFDQVKYMHEIVKKIGKKEKT